MAKYQVKKEDSMSSIAKKTGVSSNALAKANPGVKTVKTGQVIKLPKATEDTFAPQFTPTIKSPFAGANVGAGVINANPTPNLGMYNNSPYQGFQTPTTNGFVATPTPTSNIRRPVGTNNQTGFQTPTTNGFTAQPTPFLGSSSYLNPAYQTPQNTQPNTVIPRPTVPYTGGNTPTDIAWRNYWNAAARNPNSVEQLPANAPRVMTRAEIWEMKARQRRNQMAMTEGDDQTVSFGNAGYVGEGERTYMLPEQVRTISWGI